MQSLVAWLLQTDPNRRPSIEQVLTHPAIAAKVKEFQMLYPDSLPKRPKTRLGQAPKSTVLPVNGKRSSMIKEVNRKPRVEMRPIGQKQTQALGAKQEEGRHVLPKVTPGVDVKKGGRALGENGQRGNFSKKAIRSKQSLNESESEIDKLKRLAKEKRIVAGTSKPLSVVSETRGGSQLEIARMKCFAKKSQEKKPSLGVRVKSRTKVGKPETRERRLDIDQSINSRKERISQLLSRYGKNKDSGAGKGQQKESLLSGSKKSSEQNAGSISNSSPIRAKGRYSTHSSRQKVQASEAELNKNYATDTTRNSEQKQKLEISRRLESSLKKMEISTQNLLKKGRDRLDEPREEEKTQGDRKGPSQGNRSAVQLGSSANSNQRVTGKFRSGHGRRINPIITTEKSLLERKKKIVEKRLEAFSINHGEKKATGKGGSFSRWADQSEEGAESSEGRGQARPHQVINQGPKAFAAQREREKAEPEQEQFAREEKKNRAQIYKRAQYISREQVGQVSGAWITASLSSKRRIGSRESSRVSHRKSLAGSKQVSARVSNRSVTKFKKFDKLTGPRGSVKSRRSKSRGKKKSLLNRIKANAEKKGKEKVK